MPHSVSTFLMFDGTAEAAITLYAEVFDNFIVRRLERYGAKEAGTEGNIKRADIEFSAHSIICFDTPVKHAFDFTPSMSLFVECVDAAELDNAFDKLSAGGEILMPPDNYGFSRKFAWINDRFGVSWQLNQA